MGTNWTLISLFLYHLRREGMGWGRGGDIAHLKLKVALRLFTWIPIVPMTKMRARLSRWQIGPLLSKRAGHSTFENSSCSGMHQRTRARAIEVFYHTEPK